VVKTHYQKIVGSATHWVWGKKRRVFFSTRIFRDRVWDPTLIVSALLALDANQIDAAQRLRIKCSLP